MDVNKIRKELEEEIKAKVEELFGFMGIANSFILKLDSGGRVICVKFDDKE